jgi:hypothetical protein
MTRDQVAGAAILVVGFPVFLIIFAMTPLILLIGRIIPDKPNDPH